MESRWISRYLLFFMLLVSLGMAEANNIRIIGSPTLASRDTAKGTVLIKFDLAWDNSWRLSRPANYDAAWVFVKCWDGESWNHVYLDSVDCLPGVKEKGGAVNEGVSYYVSDREGKVTDQDMVLEPGYSMANKHWWVDVDDKPERCVVGYFIYRKDIGSGHVVLPGVTLKWNYGEQDFVAEDDLVVKVFAIEMVYIPKGPYYLGGIGNQLQYSFTCNGATSGFPYYVTSEDPIVVQSSPSNTTLWAVGNTIEAGSIPKDYPKGYQAFYVMKYELTQEAYCDFLNTLTPAQQIGRVTQNLNTATIGAHAYPNGQQWRNFVKIKQYSTAIEFGMDGNNNGIFDEKDTYCFDGAMVDGKCTGRMLPRNLDAQDVAMNCVSMYDVLAYADFAGLRPMTELEYEKACRGPVYPKHNEYAWGSMTKVFAAPHYNTLVDYNKGTERFADANVNVGCVVAPYSAPFRVGIFSDSMSDRVHSGATYWGVMNMSDNVAELCISATHEKVARMFVGVHGAGQLDGNGDTKMTLWYPNTSQYYYIPRGMYFHSSWTTTNYGAATFYGGMVSSRYIWQSLNCAANVRSAHLWGIRCVRTAKAQK